MFGMVGFAPNSALIPIARLNVESISRTALQDGYGGISGHYILMTDSLLKKHKDKSQKIGTGFVESKNSLFREINRGVEWVFSNSAVNLQTIINQF